MSVFHVYKDPKGGAATIGNPDHFFVGMGEAARQFPGVFATGNPNKVFFDLLEALSKANCKISFEPDGAKETEVFIDSKNMQVHYIEDKKPVNIILMADQDNPKPKMEKVTMAVPSRAVSYNDTYLVEAVNIIADTKLKDTDRQAFLLGMLLLRRCR